VRQLHRRQPVILDPDFYNAWLDPKTPVDFLHDVLSHIDDRLKFHSVSRDVAHDAPHFIEPVALFSNPL
jgi:putative SOS response-associated peptidase YedK